MFNKKNFILLMILSILIFLPACMKTGGNGMIDSDDDDDNSNNYDIEILSINPKTVNLSETITFYAEIYNPDSIDYTSICRITSGRPESGMGSAFSWTAPSSSQICSLSIDLMLNTTTIFDTTLSISVVEETDPGIYRGSISGYVFYRDLDSEIFRLAEGATVAIFEKQDTELSLNKIAANDTIATYITNEYGFYLFENLPNDVYEIKTRYESYEETQECTITQRSNSHRLDFYFEND